MNFDTKTDYILEDENVLLRPLTMDDFPHLLPFSVNEPELWTYSLFQAGGEENLYAYMQTAILSREAGIEYPFIVWDKRTGQYAGSTRFYDIQQYNNMLQLGYTWYGKAFQGTGLNKSCKYLLFRFAFEELKVDRIELRADSLNQRSIAAMKSIGCTVEGILRSNCAYPNAAPARGKGGRRDSIVLSVLTQEWHDKVKKELHKRIYGV